MRISIASFSFHGLINTRMMDVFGYLEACRYRYHLDAADIWNGLLGRDPAAYLQPEFLRKVRAALDERGLILANYHADGCHPWEDDPAARDRHHALAVRHLEAAEALGARTVRIDTGGRDKTWTPEQFEHIVRRFKEYAKRAADHGYRVGPENHWGAEVGRDNMVKLAQAVDHPGFGVLLHVGRWDGDDPDVGDRKIAPWVVHTHVDVATCQTRLDAAIGILRDAGYQGYFDVETGVGKNEYAEVGLLIAYLRRALAGLAPVNESGGKNTLIPPGAQD